MITLNGKYTSCKIFNDNVDETTIGQVYNFLNNEAFENKKVRFMSDIHAGAGAVIGTTVECGDKIIPNVIGVDIGCGMLTAKLDIKEIDLKELDTFIKNNIPSGFNTNKKAVYINSKFESEILQVCKEINIDSSRVFLSIGTLGGGNHFQELGRDEEGNLWLTVHTGSRNFGLQIAKYHQKIAEQQTLCSISEEEYKSEVEKIKKTKEGKEIYRAIEKLRKIKSVRKYKRAGLEYLTGDEAKLYIKHMKVAQEYAKLNREYIIGTILKYLNCKTLETIESVHNYIDFKDNIIRKGAISAHKDEKVIIPWNMRDGLVIGKGLGNPDWNYSAPHGAGRNMSRSKAKESINLDDFKKSMEGIYSSSVVESTIDESPMAYKDHEDIEKYLYETVEITHRVKPIYNFKSI